MLQIDSRRKTSRDISEACRVDAHICPVMPTIAISIVMMIYYHLYLQKKRYVHFVFQHKFTLDHAEFHSVPWVYIGIINRVQI